MKQPKNITYLIIAVVLCLTSVAAIYFAALHDKNTAPENSPILNHYETKENLIAKLNKQQLLIDKQSSKIILLDHKVSDLEYKNELNSIDLITKDTVINSYKEKFEKLKTLDVFECKKLTIGTNNLDVVLNCINAFKVILTEHYYSSGQFPTYLSDLNLKLMPSENELIQEISFGLDGRASFYLHSLFGADKKIALTPEIMQAGNIQFSCKTNLKQDVFPNNYCTME